MAVDINVKVGPQFYRYSEGAIDMIPTILEEHRVQKVLIVHGTISWEKAKPYLNKLFQSNIEIVCEKYRGECSYNEGQRIAEIIKDEEIDFVIGVGGGKLADLVLYTCHLAGVRFGVVPTLASNCAAWTPLSVMYKDNGLAEGKTEHVKRQASFFITDPRLVIDSPVEYFVAGIADTLAKWYESESILKQDMLINDPFPQLACYTAEMCKDTILTKSKQAVLDMKNGHASEDFRQVSEVIIAISGLVGGLGDKYARNSAAHAMHDAISKYLPEVQSYLHGEKVAYGIFYQLALEEKWSEINRLVPFYEEMELPKTLTDMGAYPLSDDNLNNIVAFVNSKEKVHLIPIEINESVLRETIIELENYFNI